jgi:two-component system, OmpR family, response regulator RegX3
MSHPDPSPPDAPGRPRVLLVEDNDAAGKGLARLLEAQGFTVSTVQDGASATRALQDEPPFDFLLTDLRLPDLDGREVARIAWEQPAPPYIALITGWDPDPDPGSYASWGIDWVFTKPLDFHELVTALRQATGSSSKPRSPFRSGDSAPGSP